MNEPQCGCILDAREHDARFSSMPKPALDARDKPRIKSGDYA